MNCFNHPDKSAVGTCKACSKGLCMDCATDLGHGLACKGRHEEIVKMHNTILERSGRMVSSPPKAALIMPALLIFIGFALWGAAFFAGHGVSVWQHLISVIFIVFGAVLFINARAYNRRVYSERNNG